MKQIPLTQGRFALVDDEDYDELSKYTWNYGMPQGYAARKIGYRGKKVYMHRQILDAPPKIDVDHINGNKLDNRRVNLRLVTRSQNLYNAAPRGGSSRFKGVCWNKPLGKWVASIQINRKLVHLGVFTDEIEAAKTYNRAATEHIGEYARLNEV